MIDQKIYLIYYIKMARQINHTRSIALGDYYRNIPTSSSPDTCDKISDIQLGIKPFGSVLKSISKTQRVNCPRRRKKELGKRISGVLMSCLPRLPRAISLTQKALQDHVASLRESFRKEPITAATNLDFLEKEQPKTDN